jgi:hypothetical protein
MTAADDFLDETMPRLMEGDKALHDGDAHPRLAMWSRQSRRTGRLALISCPDPLSSRPRTRGPFFLFPSATRPFSSARHVLRALRGTSRSASGREPE